MKIYVLGVVKRSCCPKSLWHQLVVCGALVRESTKEKNGQIGFQVVDSVLRLFRKTPCTPLLYLLLHFFHRSTNFDASVAHASQCGDTCASAEPLCLGCDESTRQLTPRLSAHTGMFHPGSKTMPLRSERHAKHDTRGEGCERSGMRAAGRDGVPVVTLSPVMYDTHIIAV